MHSILEKFKTVGRWSCGKKNFKVELDDFEHVRCVYVFLDSDGKALRAGKAETGLAKRFRDYERDVTKALVGQKSPTPQEEAQAWCAAGYGTMVALSPNAVHTEVGRIVPVKDIEGTVITTLRLSGQCTLNRSNR